MWQQTRKDLEGFLLLGLRAGGQNWDIKPIDRRKYSRAMTSSYAPAISVSTAAMMSGSVGSIAELKAAFR